MNVMMSSWSPIGRTTARRWHRPARAPLLAALVVAMSVALFAPGIAAAERSRG